MIPKVIIVATAIFSTASAAPQVYQARGVHHPTAQESGELSKALAATLNILPELSTVLQKISTDEGGAYSSDPNSIGNIVSAFLPLSDQTISLRDTFTGQPSSKEEQEKLKVVAEIMPVVSSFIADMRSLGSNWQSSSGNQYGTGSQSSEPTGELQLDTRGSNEGMVEAVLELLPEISQVFQQINSDPARSNPMDQDFVYRVIMAFMPLSKKALQATAKAEGRFVSQEELQTLNVVDNVMPAVIKFMKSLGGLSASAFQNTAVGGHTVLNSRFDSPKPATYKEPAFPQHSPKPVSSSSYNPATSHAFPAPIPSVVSGVNPLNLPSRFETPEPATFKQPAFPGQTSSTGLRSSGANPLILPSRFETPAPATFKQPAFPGQTSSTGLRSSGIKQETPMPALSGVKPLILPSRFETPAPATFKQPAFPGQTSSTGLTSSGAKPVTSMPAFPQQPGSSISLRTFQAAVAPQHTYPLATRTVSSTPLRSPAYPELSYVVPPVYQAFIPTVPDNLSGLPSFYSFSTVYGR